MSTGAPQPDKLRLGGNYWKLFSSSTLANLGDGLVAVAIVWLASSITRDPFLLTVVGLATRLPWLLFSLPAGVISDRYDRKILVGSMDVLRFVVITAFATLLAFNQSGLPSPEELAAGAPAPSNAGILIAGLCAMALVLGFAEVLRDNTAQTLMPSVVDKRLLEKANGRMWGAETVMNQFVGPPLAGALIAVAVAIPFGVNAGLLAISAWLIFSLRGSYSPKADPALQADGLEPTAAQPQSTTRTNWRAQLAQGFGWLWRHKLLRTLALLLGALNLLGQVPMVIFVLFAQDVLGLFEGWQFGLLLTGMATGGVAGSLVAERIVAALNESRALLLSIVVMAATYCAMGLLRPAIGVWVASVILGVAIVVWNVITVSLRQRIIPDHLLGRVNSVYRFFGWGTMSIGILIGGALVTFLEPGLGREWALRTPFLVCGLLTAALLPIAWRRLSLPAIERAKAQLAT